MTHTKTPYRQFKDLQKPPHDLSECAAFNRVLEEHCEAFELCGRIDGASKASQGRYHDR